MSPRNLGAGAGLVAAAVTAGYIVVRLLQAAAPTPLSLVVQAGELPLALNGISVNGASVLTASVLLQPMQTLAAGPGGPLSAPLLPVGRPLQVEVTSAGGAVSACTSDPRPHGACVLVLRWQHQHAMQCQFKCPAESSSP